MAASYIITETADALRIDFPNNMKPIVKFGFLFQAFMIFAFSISFLTLIFYTAFEMSNWYALVFLIPATFAVLYLIGGRTYLKKLTYTQEIIVRKDSLKIVESALFTETIKTYKAEDMSYLSFAGQQDFTNHIMTNNTFDAMGFSTQEKEIQTLISDGTISFFYHGETIRFGNNIPSWDAEEILERINLITENQIRKKIV